MYSIYLPFFDQAGRCSIRYAHNLHHLPCRVASAFYFIFRTLWNLSSGAIRYVRCKLYTWFEAGKSQSVIVSARIVRSKGYNYEDTIYHRSCGVVSYFSPFISCFFLSIPAQLLRASRCILVDRSEGKSRPIPSAVALDLLLFAMH